MSKRLHSIMRALRIAFAGSMFTMAASVSPACAADDKSTISSFMELFGVSSDPSAASINYQERPNIVVPPTAGALPPPSARAVPDGWPTDAGTTRRRNTDRYAKVRNAPEEEKKPGLLERIRGPKPDYAPGTDDEPGLLQRVLKARSTNTLPSEEPRRRMLTDPPAGYRRPTVDVSAISDGEAKKSNWWNPFGRLSGSDEQDPVAQLGASASAQKLVPSSAHGGPLANMMPSFMKGSQD